MEQYLQRSAIPGNFNEDGASFENWKSSPSTINKPESNPSVGFECNICLDLVQDPVVTLCGHLYCWPCIYRWISFHDDDASTENPHQQTPQCPVCKREVSEKTLIPLYGRGQATNLSKSKVSDFIPQRPPSPRCWGNIILPNSTNNHSSSFDHRNYVQPSRPYMQSPMVGLGGSTMHLVDPVIGMFRETFYARIFGNSETSSYTYPNSYHLAGSNSPRLQRHMMQTDKSLSRVCFFLCCCAIICLLLF